MDDDKQNLKDIFDDPNFKSQLSQYMSARGAVGGRIGSRKKKAEGGVKTALKRWGDKPRCPACWQKLPKDALRTLEKKKIAPTTYKAVVHQMKEVEALKMADVDSANEAYRKEYIKKVRKIITDDMGLK
jgi:hypothetical protein